MSFGKDKAALSLVQKELSAVDVCNMFGHFVKFTVGEPEVSSTRTLDVAPVIIVCMFFVCKCV